MKNTYIKLFIGLTLFATLVALTVFHVQGADRLIDLIYAALLGLGIMHLGSQPADPSAAAPDKQAGRALPALLGIVASIAAGLMLLAGCASITGSQATTQTAQVTYTQACMAYGAAFAAALELRRAGKLNHAQIDQVTLLDSQITPICTGPLPADPNAATQQVAGAVTALTILEVAQKAH